MAEAPYMPFFTDAYLGDTTHLTTLEHGAYCLLLFTMWRGGGYLKNDDNLLARYAKLTTNQWAKMKGVLMDFFVVEGDRITQPRLYDELERVRMRSRVQAENARAKSRKDKEQVRAAAVPKSTRSPAPTLTPTFTFTDLPAGDTPQPPSGDILVDAWQAWNDAAKRFGLPTVQKLTAPRKARLRARLDDVNGLEGWRIALALIGESDFLTGRTQSGYRATFDFVLQESSFVKLLEGNYASNKRAASPAMEALRRLRESN